MKKLILAIALLVCMGCTASEVEVLKERSSRFVVVEDTGRWVAVYDRRTKVMYAVSIRGTFTLLVDANGNPLLWEGTTK